MPDEDGDGRAISGATPLAWGRLVMKPTVGRPGASDISEVPGKS